MDGRSNNHATRLDEIFTGVRMFAIVCDECGEDGGHATDCPGRIALGIDDGRGHATTVSDCDGGRPAFTRHDHAECAEAFYDIVRPSRLVWADAEHE